MGLKKVARNLHKSRNLFVKFLKKNKATSFYEYIGAIDNGWDYYRNISAFVGKDHYVVYFSMYKGVEKIHFEKTTKYNEIDLSKFLSLLPQ